MAEEIVACPSCGKKFRIPEGAPPGSFKCTACEADVSYGAPAAAPTGGGGAPRRGAGGAKKSRGARRGKARRQREAAGGSAQDRRAAREARQTEKGANTGAIVASIMGGLVVLVLVVLALKGGKDEEPDAVPVDEAAETATGLDGSDGTDDAADATSGGGDAATDDAAGSGSTTPAAGSGGGGMDEQDEGDEEDDDDSGIGGSGRRPSSSKIFTMDAEKLFVDYPFLDETPAEEREVISMSVSQLVDRNSGRKGVIAQNDLEKIGKPAIPALLSTWKGRTWDNEDDQLATDIVQRVLRKIVKDDGPTSDFHARFVPHEPIDAAKFERAGRMWIAWWLSKGIDIEKYSYADDE